MEYETDVFVKEDFSYWSNEMKIELIEAICNNKTYEFTGTNILSIDCP